MTFYFFFTSVVNQTNGLIGVDKFKAVTILSINRPDKQNAMNEALLNELATHLTQFENDVDARAVVLHGIGGNFSIGYDTDELKQKCQQNRDTIRSSLFVSLSCISNAIASLNVKKISQFFGSSFRFGVKLPNHFCAV